MEIDVPHILCFKKQDLLIFTSYKVLFSSLKVLANDNKLELINKYDLVENWNKLQYLHKIGLVRNPTHRIESLFKDKVIFNIDKNYIQLCQQNIIDVFGYDNFINKKITFDQFIYNLDKLIHQDSHFHTQNSFIPKIINDILYIDHPSDIQRFNSLIGHNAPIMNRTPKLKLSWTLEMRMVFYNLYKEDFDRFFKGKKIYDN